MQKQQRNELVVGLIFFVGMVFLGVYTIILSGLFTGPQKSFAVTFPNIYGLKKGDQVRVEGLVKGEVATLGLDTSAKGEERVVARINVATDVEIYKDGSEVKVTPFSPLGGRIVEIKRGYDSPRGKYLSVEEAEAKQLSPEEYRIRGTAEGELLQTLNNLVDENRPGIAKIVSNLAFVSDRLTQTDSILGTLINDTGTGSNLQLMASEITETAMNVNKIVKRINAGDGVIGELTVKSSKLHDNVNGAAENANHALESVNTMLVRANEGRSALGVLVSDDPQVSGDAKAIVHDISLVTSDVAAGQGSLGKFVTDPRFYDGATSTVENLGVITSNIMTSKSAVGVLLNDPETGSAVKNTLSHLDSIAGSVDQGRGTLGLIVRDERFQHRVERIFTEIERLTVEFRDSVEDLREQAPINAFLGAVFAAF